MKKILIQFLFVLGIIPCTSFVCVSDVEWVLRFEDNFDGDALDRKVWHAWRGVSRDFELNGTRQWYTPENAVVSDGTLKMMIKEELHTGDFVIDWDTREKKTATFKYSAADLYTNTSYHYGKYEARCKIPKGKGLVPAFWLFGSDNHQHNEIDVFEFWNEQTWFKKYSKRKESRVHHMTAHYHGMMSAKRYRGVDFSKDFHVFTVIWEKDKIEWLVDGVLKRRYKRSNKNQVFPDFPMEIRLNVGVRPGYDAPDSTVHFPQALEVDYVRHWVKKN